MKQNIFLVANWLLLFTAPRVVFSQSDPTVETNVPSSFYQPKVTRSVSHLLAFPKLHVFIPNCDFEMKFKVIRYECVIQSKKREDQFFVIQGANYPPELIEAIRNLKKGDKIFFEHIRCMGEDKLVRDIAGKEITIL